MKRSRVFLILCAALLLIFGALALYVRTDRFHAYVRHKIVNAIEDATGGRVEIGKISWSFPRLDFVADDVTIHGLEPASEPPYVHVTRITGEAKLVSLLGSVDLQSLTITNPSVHLTIDANGRSNLPVPKKRSSASGSAADELIKLAIGRLQVSEGVLQINNKRIPLDFLAENISLRMTYNVAKNVYAANAHLGEGVLRVSHGQSLAFNADAELELAANRLVIQSLKAQTAASRWSATGTITNFVAPKLDLTYNASIAAAEIGRTVSLSELSQGTINIEGAANGTWPDIKTQGKLVGSNLTFGQKLRANNVASRFTADGSKVLLSSIVAQSLGGIVKGTAQISDWRDKKLGEAHFSLQNLAVPDLVALLSTRSLALERLRLAGSTSGTLTATWMETPDRALGEVDLKVVSPQTIASDQSPISGEVSGKFDVARQMISLKVAEISSPLFSISARGDLGSQRSELKVSAQTDLMKDVQPLLQATTGANEWPIEAVGAASFQGSIYGKLLSPQFVGKTELHDFTVFLPPGKRSVHFDSLTANLNLGPRWIEIRDGAVTRGPTAMKFSGNSTLNRWKLTESSTFLVSGTFTDAPASDIQEVIGSKLGVEALFSGEGTIHGSTRELRGEMRVLAPEGTVYGEAIKNLSAEIQLAGQEVLVRSLKLSQNGAKLSGSGSFNTASEQFRAEVHTRDINLAHITQLQRPRLSVRGLGDLDVTAAGTLDAPSVNGRLRFHDIYANGEHIGDINIEAVTRGREMQVTMRSQLEAASLSVDGKIQLTKNLPGTLIAHFEKFDFDPLLRTYFEDRITGHSSANGRVEIGGTFRDPKSLRVHGLIPELSAQIEKVTLTNAEPIEFSYADRVAELRSFHLRGENTDLRASGRFNLADLSLNMEAKGDVNLRLAEGFYPGLVSYGTVGVQMRLKGTLKRPIAVGQVAIRDAGVSLVDLPNGLSNINGTLIFNENRLQVQTLTANTGGGALNIGGFISYQNGIYFDLTARGNDVRLRYPPGISAAANADLRYSGTPKASLLSGDILVTRFAVNPRFDFAAYLARSKNAAMGPSANTLLDNMRLDVHVTSTPELRVETELAKIAGDADLRIRGTLGRPAVLGRVNIAEGDIFFNATKYHLERGDISFNNPVRIEPVLNVEASARVREYDITLGFHGSTEKLSTTYRSEPPLPTADIIALLALGRTREDAVLNNQPVQQNFAETASNAILGQALDAAVSSRVQKLFGVSRIKIDPQVGGPESATGARVTIEQQVNNNVTLTYITNVARANQQIIQGEFNFTRDLSLVIVRDENGVLGFDIRIRQRKK